MLEELPESGRLRLAVRGQSGGSINVGRNESLPD